MDNRSVNLIQVVFFSVPAFLHLLCLFILCKARKSKLQKQRRLYLMNLSFSEFFLTIGYLLRRAFLLQGVPFESKAFFCLEIIQNGGLFLWYMFIMTVITVDRFLEVYLNIRYNVTWPLRKALITLWMSFLIPCVLVLVYFIKFDDYHAARYHNSVYLWPIVEFTVTIIAVPVYIYISRKVQHNKTERLSLRRHLSRTSSSSDQPEPIYRRNRLRDNSYLPMLLIATFFVFWIVPDQVLFIAKVCKMELSSSALLAIGLLFAIGFTCDPMLYIFFSRDIRKTIRKIFTARGNDTKNISLIFERARFFDKQT